ncbi:MAG TPA: hypothetical protein VMI54_03710 [Polyangiaceae bacterium]|nr:hypothetical protein [Polyangiaceae bacterium]
MNLPGTAAWRRRVAFLFLGVGTVVASRAVSRDLPHDQTFVFRLDESERHEPLKLSASFVRVGESEPRAGVSLSRDGSENADPRQTLHLPNGDYVVTVEWEHVGKAALDDARDGKESETSRVERVTLSGGETIVLLPKRVSE